MARARCSSAPTRRPSDVAVSKGPVQTAADIPLAVKGRALRQSENGDLNQPHSRRTTTPDPIHVRRGRLSSPHPAESRPVSSRATSAAIGRKASPQPRHEQPPFRVPRAATAAAAAQPSPRDASRATSAAASRASSPGPPQRPISASAAGQPRFTAAPLPYHQRLRGLLDGYRPASAGQADTPLAPPAPRPPSAERQSRPTSQQQYHVQQQRRPGSAAGLTATDISVCIEGKSMELCHPAARHERPGGGVVVGAAAGVWRRSSVAGGGGLDPHHQQQHRQQEAGEGALVPVGPEAEEYWEWLMKEEPPPESPYGSDVLRALISVISPKFAVKRPADYVPITPSSLSSSRYVRSDIWPGSSPSSPALPLTTDPLAAPVSPAEGPGATSGDVTSTKTSPTAGASAAAAAPVPPLKPLNLPMRVTSARQSGPSPRGPASEEVLQRRLLRRAASAAMAAVISAGGATSPARLLYGSRHVPYMVPAAGEPTLRPVVSVSASGMVGTLQQQQQYEKQQQAKLYREGASGAQAPKSDPGAIRRNSAAAAAPVGGTQLVAEEPVRAPGGAASAGVSTASDGMRRDLGGSGGEAVRPRSGCLAGEGPHAATAATVTSPRSPGQGAARRRRRRSSAVSGGHSTGSPRGPLSPQKDEPLDRPIGPAAVPPVLPMSSSSPFAMLASVSFSPRGGARNDAIEGQSCSVIRSSVHTAPALAAPCTGAFVRQSRDAASRRSATAPGSPPARVREREKGSWPQSGPLGSQEGAALSHEVGGKGRQQQRLPQEQQQAAESRRRWAVVDHESRGSGTNMGALVPPQAAGVWVCEPLMGGMTAVTTSSATTSGSVDGGEDGSLGARHQACRPPRPHSSTQTQQAHRKSREDVAQGVRQQDVRYPVQHSEQFSLQASSTRDTEPADRQQQDVRQQEGGLQVGLHHHSVSSSASSSGGVLGGGGIATAAPAGPTAPAGGGSTAAVGGGKSRFYRQQAASRPSSACDTQTLANPLWSQAATPPPLPLEKEQHSPPSSQPLSLSSLTLLQWDEHHVNDPSCRREGAGGDASGCGGHGGVGEKVDKQMLRPPRPPVQDMRQGHEPYGSHHPYQQHQQQPQQQAHTSQRQQNRPHQKQHAQQLQQQARPHPYQQPQPHGSSEYPPAREVRINGRRRWGGPRSPTKSPQKQDGPPDQQHQQQRRLLHASPPHPPWATPEGSTTGYNGLVSSRGGPPSSSASGSAATASVTYSAATSSSSTSAATSTASTPASVPVSRAGLGGWGSSAATSTDESPCYPHAAKAGASNIITATPAAAPPPVAIAVRTAHTECGGVPSSIPSRTPALPIPGASPSTSSGSPFALHFRPRAHSASASPYDSPIRPAPPILHSSPSSGPRRSPPVILPLTWEPPPLPSPNLLRMGTPAKVRHSPLRLEGASSPSPNSSPSGQSGGPPDGMAGPSSSRMTHDSNGSTSGVMVSRFAPTAVQYDSSAQYSSSGGSNPNRVEVVGRERWADGGVVGAERRPLAWIGPTNGRQLQPRQPQAPAAIRGDGSGGAERRGWMTGAVFTAVDTTAVEPGKAGEGRLRREDSNSESAGGVVLDAALAGRMCGLPGVPAAAGPIGSVVGRPQHHEGALSARGGAGASQQSQSYRRRWTIAEGDVGGMGPTQPPELHGHHQPPPACPQAADGSGAVGAVSPRVRDAIGGRGGASRGSSRAHLPRGDGHRGSGRRSGSGRLSNDHTASVPAGAAASAAPVSAPASPGPPASPHQTPGGDLHEITLSAPFGAASAVAVALGNDDAAGDGVRRNLLMSFRHVGGPPPPPPATAPLASTSSTTMLQHPVAVREPPRPSSTASVAVPNGSQPHAVCALPMPSVLSEDSAASTASGAVPPSRRRRWEPREGSVPEERDIESEVGVASQGAAGAAPGRPPVHNHQAMMAERAVGPGAPLDHRDSNPPRRGWAPACASSSTRATRARPADAAAGNFPGSAPTQDRAAAVTTTAAAEMVTGLLDVGESSSAVHRGSSGQSGRQYSNQRNRERAMMLNRVMEALGLGHLSVPTP